MYVVLCVCSQAVRKKCKKKKQIMKEKAEVNKEEEDIGEDA